MYSLISFKTPSTRLKFEKEVEERVSSYIYNINKSNNLMNDKFQDIEAE